jgi:Aspartyl protease
MGKASRRKRARSRPAGEVPEPARNVPTVEIPRIQTRTIQRYGPEFLQRCGPMMVGSWWLPQALAQVRAASGKSIPPPKKGAILIDTGADGTCISESVARGLGLHPTRSQRGYGAGGEHQLPVFLAAIEIEIKDPASNRATRIGWEQEALGIPSLGAARKVNCDGVDLEIIGLLGRDFLRFCRVVYDGPAGTIEFELNMAAIKLQPSR